MSQSFGLWMLSRFELPCRSEKPERLTKIHVPHLVGCDLVVDPHRLLSALDLDIIPDQMVVLVQYLAVVVLVSLRYGVAEGPGVSDRGRAPLSFLVELVPQLDRRRSRR